METLQQALHTFLHHQFQVVPVRTSRQDQWYKRTYQSWKEENGESEPLILAPKVAKEEWASDLRRVAAVFAHAIEQAAAEEQKYQERLSTPSNAKLFEDSVLDMPSHQSSPALTPLMQRVDYWTLAMPSGVLPPRGWQTAIMELLKRRQLQCLLHLASHPDVRKLMTGEKARPDWQNNREHEAAWTLIFEDQTRLLICLIILQSFREFLISENGYRKWIPFAFSTSRQCLSARHKDIIEDTLARHPSQRGKGNSSVSAFQLEIENCFSILAQAHILHEACGLKPLNWERLWTDNLLFFVGFEAWNRDREGQSYLGCDLNKTKNDKWLRQWTQDGRDPGQDVPMPKKEPTRKKDPLHLREAKQEPAQEADEQQMELMDCLADLELKEASYGRKRSIKYRREGQ